MPAEETPHSDPPGPPNIKFPTLGGKQLWADVFYFHQWHIQRDVLTDHYRLLSPSNVRLAWGSFEACQAMLAEIRSERQVPRMSGKAVVVLHGLGRTHSAMSRMAEALRQRGGYTVFNVTYPTLLGSIGEHAQTLDRVIRSLEGIEEVNFVCHSLGNLVVRRWLHDTMTEAGQPREAHRLGRMVMLSPPNQRPELAGKVGSLKLAQVIGGKAFRELALSWDELAPTLATPAFEFGIITGGRGSDRGYNPFVPGDDDMIVSVRSTRLAGAADFRVLRVAHTFMMNDETVQDFTLRFLKEGYFESIEAKQPIGEEGAQPEPVIPGHGHSQ